MKLSINEGFQHSLHVLLCPVSPCLQQLISFSNFLRQPFSIFLSIPSGMVAPNSAIKRAYNKKDFDSFIPGHGGMMDRMDCQLLMNSFTTFYYYSFIAGSAQTVQRMLFLASEMTLENRELLFQEVSVCVLLFKLS
jgi:hypothetical protein